MKIRHFVKLVKEIASDSGRAGWAIEAIVMDDGYVEILARVAARHIETLQEECLDAGLV